MKKRSAFQRVVALVLCMMMIGTSAPVAAAEEPAPEVQAEKTVPDTIPESIPGVSEDIPKAEEPTQEPTQEPPIAEIKPEASIVDAMVQVHWFDYDNIGGRRLLEGGQLLKVYADGVLLESQPTILVQELAEGPYKEFGMQTFTYTLKDMNRFRADGTLVSYSVRQSTELMPGYVPMSAAAFGGKLSEGEVDEALASMENLSAEIVLIEVADAQTGETRLQASKTFGNYLPEYQVSGSVTWEDKGTNQRPAMEAWFASQFTIDRGEQEVYSAYQVHYEQDLEEATKWNYTVRGLFVTDEQGSAVNYQIRAAESEGYELSKVPAVIQQDTSNADVILRVKEEQAQPKRKEGITARSAIATKAAVGDKTVTDTEDQTLAAVYFDDDKSLRPDPDKYITDNVLISFETNGSTYYLPNKAAEKAGKSPIKDEQWTSFFGTTAKPSVTKNTSGTGTFQAYTLNNAPKTVKTTYAEGEPETQSFAWALGEYWDKTKHPFYLTPINKPSGGYSNAYLHFKDAGFHFNLQISQGEDGSIGGNGKQYLEQFKGEMELWYRIGKNETKMGVLNDSLSFEGQTDSVKVQGKETDQTSVDLAGLPMFTENDVEIVYYIKCKSDKLLEQSNKDYYTRSFDNAKSDNFGSVTDAAHKGGTLELTLRGGTTYKAHKVWLDEGTPAIKAKRPAATLFLWRYTEKDGSNYQEAVQVNMPKEGKLTPISWTIDGKKQDRSTIDYETIPNRDELPKYNPEGYPYVYLTREVLSSAKEDNSYEQVFVKNVTPKETGPITAITEDNREGNADKSLYNNGILANRITGKTNVSWKKMWSASNYQNQLTQVEVDLGLYIQDTDDKVQEITVKDFRPETLIREGSESVSKYDELGKPITYVWKEDAIREGGVACPLTDKEGAADIKVFQLSHNDPDTNPNNMSPNGHDKEWYESESVITEKDGKSQTTIINTLKGTTTYTVDKLWAQLDAQGNVKKDSAGQTEYGKAPPTKDASVSVELYQDGTKMPNEATKSLTEDNQFFYEYKDLPKYDEGGVRHTYIAKEAKSVPEDWHVSTSYNVNDTVQQKYFDCQMKNSPVGHGKSIAIQKEWLDDGDEQHRESVWVAVYRKKQGSETSDHYFGCYPLEKSGNWRLEVGVGETDTNGDPLYPELPNEEYYIREVGIGSKSPANEYNKYGGSGEYRTETDGDTPGAATGGGAPVFDKGISEVAPSVDEIEGTNHTYEVTYAVVDGEFVIRNRRVGIVNIDVAKTWVDGKNENGARTAMLEAAKAKGESVNVTLVPNASDTYSDKAIEIGTNTVTIAGVHEGAGGKLPIKASGEADAQEAASVQEVTDDNEKNYTYYNLPKYDAKGRVIHYSIEENNVLDPYQKSIVQTSYSYNELGGTSADFSSDKQVMTVTNTRKANKKVIFYKHWIDQYVYETLQKRPDVFLNIYQNSQSQTTATNYLCDSWKTQATSDNAADMKDYYWQWEYNSLPRYDAKGYEIFYYAEEKSKVAMETLDYQTVELHKVYQGYQGKHSATKELLNYGGTTLLPENGTFVNRIAKLVQVSGKKVWKNIPVGFPNTELPKLKIIVQQKRKIAEGKYEYRVKEGGAWESYDEKKVKENGQRDYYGYAWTETWTKIDSTNHIYNFYLDKKGENTYDTATNPQPEQITARNQTNEAFLPKYDAKTGSMYEYDVTEQVMSTGSDDMDLSTTYELLPGDVNNYIITNTYDIDTKNVDKLKVNKIWDGWGSLGTTFKYPVVTFEVWRVYQTKGDTTPSYSKAEKVTSKEYNHNQAQPNITGVTFEQLPVYAPNGTKYWYYVVEQPINGYDVEISAEGTPGTEAPDWVTVGGDPEAKVTSGVQLRKDSGTSSIGKVAAFFTGKAGEPIPELSFTNTYTGGGSVALAGAKKWMDNWDNVSRPSEVKLSLYRWAVGQGNSENGIFTSKDPQLMAKDISLKKSSATTLSLETGVVQKSNSVTIAHDNTVDWSFRISGLDKYAPNGQPWMYRITETPLDGYRGEPGSVQIAADKIEETTTSVKLPELKNSNYTTASFTKQWSEDSQDAYGLRPDNITVKLQVREGTTGTWADASSSTLLPNGVSTNVPYSLKVKKDGTFTKDDGDDLEDSQKPNVTHTKENDTSDVQSWGTWTILKLPSGKYINDNFTPYQYRFIETKIGEAEVTITQEGKYGEEGTHKLYVPSGEEKFTQATNQKESFTSSTTIKNTQKDNISTTLTVTKIWEDNKDRYESRPKNKQGKWTLTFYLQRRLVNGTEADWSDISKVGTEGNNDTDYITRTVTEEDFTEGASSTSGGQTFTDCEFENLPKYNESGLEYVYRASETSSRLAGKNYTPSGYTTTTESSVDSSCIITNTLDPIEITATKGWNNELGESKKSDKEWMEGRKVTLELLKKEGTQFKSFKVPVRVELDGSAEGSAAGLYYEEEAWKAIFSGVPRYTGTTLAEYKVIEVEKTEDDFSQKVVDGFWVSTTPESVTATATDQTYILNVTNQQTGFNLKKTDSDGATITRPLTLAIYKDTTSPILIPANLMASCELTAGAMAKIKGLPQGNYILHEEKVPQGYEKAADIKFSINAKGQLTSTVDGAVTAGEEDQLSMQTLTMKDTPITLTLAKKNFEGATIEEATLGYAKFTVTGTFAGTTDTEITGITTANVAEKLKLKLIAGEKYTFAETEAPKGYELAAPFTFSIDEQGEVTIQDTLDYVEVDESQKGLIVKDRQIEVALRKVSTDSFGQTDTSIMDEHCTFKITPSGEADAFAVDIPNKEIIIETTNAKTALKGMLIAGHTYRVTEVTAPKGYALAEAFTFTVETDGDITVSKEAEGYAKVIPGDGGQVEVVVADRPIAVKIMKRLTGDQLEKGIEGAEFVLTGLLADGSTEHSLTSAEDAITMTGLLVAGETYTLTETKAPEGSMIPTEEVIEQFAFDFTVEKDGTVKDVLPTPPDSGTGLSYHREDNTLTFWNQPTQLVVFKKGTDQAGSAQDPLMSECTFEVTGVFAPDRYKKEAKLEKLARMISRTVQDRKSETIRVTTTGEDGLDNALKGRLIVGETYTIKEIVAPNGYQLGGAMTFKIGSVTANEDGAMQLKLEVTDTNGNYDISYDEKGNTVITQRDFPVGFKIRKVNENKAALKGAKFEVTGVFEKEGIESTRSFESDENGFVDLSKMISECNETTGKEYIYKLTEKEAPHGYTKMEGDIWFRIKSVNQGDGMHRSETEIVYGSGRTAESLRDSLAVTKQDGVEILDVVNSKVEEETPTVSDRTSGSTGAKTGDKSSVVLYAILAILAGGTSCAVIRRKKKKIK